MEKKHKTMISSIFCVSVVLIAFLCSFAIYKTRTDPIIIRDIFSIEEKYLEMGVEPHIAWAKENIPWHTFEPKKGEGEKLERLEVRIPIESYAGNPWEALLTTLTSFDTTQEIIFVFQPTEKASRENSWLILSETPIIVHLSENWAPTLAKRNLDEMLAIERTYRGGEAERAKQNMVRRYLERFIKEYTATELEEKSVEWSENILSWEKLVVTIKREDPPYKNVGTLEKPLIILRGPTLGGEKTRILIPKIGIIIVEGKTSEELYKASATLGNILYREHLGRYKQTTPRQP